MLLYYSHQLDHIEAQEKTNAGRKEGGPVHEKPEIVYQCRDCLTVYDELYGDPVQNISAGTSFSSLPDHYCCALCEADKANFSAVEKNILHAQPV
jgi:rubredoxin